MKIQNKSLLYMNTQNENINQNFHFNLIFKRILNLCILNENSSHTFNMKFFGSNIV